MYHTIQRVLYTQCMCYVTCNLLEIRVYLYVVRTIYSVLYNVHSNCWSCRSRENSVLRANNGNNGIDERFTR